MSHRFSVILIFVTRCFVLIRKIWNIQRSWYTTMHNLWHTAKPRSRDKRNACILKSVYTSVCFTLTIHGFTMLRLNPRWLISTVLSLQQFSRHLNTACIFVHDTQRRSIQVDVMYWPNLAMRNDKSCAIDHVYKPADELVVGCRPVELPRNMGHLWVAYDMRRHSWDYDKITWHTHV